jgi:hypothetical protein
MKQLEIGSLQGAFQEESIDNSGLNVIVLCRRMRFQGQPATITAYDSTMQY